MILFLPQTATSLLGLIYHMIPWLVFVYGEKEAGKPLKEKTEVNKAIGFSFDT